MIRVARLRRRSDLIASAERRVRLVGADLHDGAERVALDRRLGVAEKRLEVGQRLGAAERAQQLDGRAADRRVRRVPQLVDVARGRPRRS